MIRIGRTYWFSSAHHLPSHKGACKNSHGHNYRVEIVVKGKPSLVEKDPNWGMIMDFGDLDKIVNPIIEEFDHKNLNDIMENPTAENISRELAKRIMKSFMNVSISITDLSSVKIWENHRSYAEWRVHYENI